VHLCRWACDPLQGRYPTQQAAQEQVDGALGLLHLAAHDGGSRSGSGGGSGSGSGGRKSGSSGSGSSRSSLCGAAMAAAGPLQLQRCAARLADLLSAVVLQREPPGFARQLAAAARLLRCMCGCSGSGGGGGSCPVTVACLHSRPGRRLLQTRVAAPALLLRTAVAWFDASGPAPLARLLQSEVRRVCVAWS
jgi:hypothetical protein